MSKARGPYKVDPLGYKKANEALDKKAENARELGLDYEPVQQEPWPDEPKGHMAGGVQLSGTSKSKAITELYALFGAPHNADINLTGLNRLLDELIASPPAQPMHPEIKKMYEDYFDKCFRESSTAQRTWVGLTDDERGQTINANLGAGWWSMAKDIEAKLKEKNT
jgi:hypothetical protein